MKNGTKVKVVACTTGHEFDIGEIVERLESEYDYEYKDSLGFISEDGEVWYMTAGEYELIQSDYQTEKELEYYKKLSKDLAHYLSSALVSAQYSMTEETMHHALELCKEAHSNGVVGKGE